MANRICDVEGCARPHKARGKCANHYRSPNRCKVDGCARSRDGHGYCRMHRRRWQASGDPGEIDARHRPDGQGNLRSDGYIITRMPEHPLARHRGYVYLHRAVLYDAIGAGGHPCHWCGSLVVWEDGSLTADHLDWNRENNDPANLIPSCLACNSKRYRLRTDRGSANPNAKLRECDVQAIRRSTEPHAVIAGHFGVSESLISMIKNRRVWGWLATQD